VGKNSDESSGAELEKSGTLLAAEEKNVQGGSRGMSEIGLPGT